MAPDRGNGLTDGILAAGERTQLAAAPKPRSALWAQWLFTHLPRSRRGEKLG